MPAYQKYESVRDIVRRASVLTGLEQPQQVIGNDDPGVVLRLGLLEQAGRMLLSYPWTQLIRTWYVSFNPAQGSYVALPPDFNGFIPVTGYNDVAQTPARPSGAGRWEVMRVTGMGGTDSIWVRVIDGNMYFSPTPTSTTNFSFEYHSRSWLKNGNVYSDNVQSDSDIVMYDSLLMEMAVKTLFLEAKGFDSAAANMRFNQHMLDVQSRDRDSSVLSLETTSRGRGEGRW